MHRTLHTRNKLQTLQFIVFQMNSYFSLSRTFRFFFLFRLFVTCCWLPVDLVWLLLPVSPFLNTLFILCCVHYTHLLCTMNTKNNGVAVALLALSLFIHHKLTALFLHRTLLSFGMPENSWKKFTLPGSHRQEWYNNNKLRTRQKTSLFSFGYCDMLVSRLLYARRQFYSIVLF